jgi:hypothetical protein
MGLKYIFSPLDIDTITSTIKMAKKVNPWMEHLKKFRAANKGMNNKLIFAAAKKTYKSIPKQIGGLSALSPEAVSGMSSSGVDLDTQVATQHGGKRRSTKRSAKKRSTKRSAKRSTKKRSAKRRH